jgi:hypothetical protein
MFNFEKIKLKKEIKKHDKCYIKNPIKLEEPLKRITYEYKILLINHEILEGECTVNYPDDLAEMFLRNKYTICENGKVIWYNSDNIIEFQAIEKSKKID